MKIGIIGSRRRNNVTDYLEIVKQLNKIYTPGDMIVSGGCPNGGDKFAEDIAKAYQIPITIYHAQWNKLGKRAGFARNTDIARDADILIACVASDRTGGTEDTIKKYLALNKTRLILC